MQKLIDQVKAEILSYRAPTTEPELRKNQAEKAELLLERTFFSDEFPLTKCKERIDAVCEMLINTSKGGYLKEQLQNWYKIQAHQNHRVLTTDQLQETLKQITFQYSSLDFEWRFEVSDISVGDRKGWLVYTKFYRTCSTTGEAGWGRGRDEIIWEGTTVSGVVKTAWLLIELLIRHELMEGFRWMGQRIFNPHNSVVDLAKVQFIHEAGL